jgi:hypothetical protein
VKAQVLEAMANAVGYVADNVQARITGTPPKVRKPRKARATSKFVVLTSDLVEQVTTDPNIVAARKRIETSGLSGTFYIACLREEVIVETTVPTPVTKVTVKRVAR